MENKPSGGEVRLFKDSGLLFGPRDWRNLYFEFSAKRDKDFRPFITQVYGIIQQLDSHADYDAVRDTLLSYAIENYRLGIAVTDITVKVQETVGSYLEILGSDKE